MSDVVSQMSGNGTVVPFDLFIGLGMIRRVAESFNAKHYYHSVPDVRHELGPSVLQDPLQRPVGGHPRVDDC